MIFYIVLKMNQKKIVFEGIDGVGKTFLCNKLKFFSNKINITSEIIPEFIDDFAGGFIPLKLKTDKFIKLNDKFDTVLSQTFFLTSSHLYKYELAIQQHPNIPLLIFDRFLFSVLAFQMVLLEKSNEVKIEAIEAFYHSIKALLPSDLMVIYLSCENNILTKRFTDRGDYYTTADLNFLNDVAKKYSFILDDCKVPFIRIDTSCINDEDISDLFNKILIH
jgi:thymidylate kinase